MLDVFCRNNRKVTRMTPLLACLTVSQGGILLYSSGAENLRITSLPSSKTHSNSFTHLPFLHFSNTCFHFHALSCLIVLGFRDARHAVDPLVGRCDPLFISDIPSWNAEGCCPPPACLERLYQSLECKCDLPTLATRQFKALGIL